MQAVGLTATVHISGLLSRGLYTRSSRFRAPDHSDARGILYCPASGLWAGGTSYLLKDWSPTGKH